MLQYTITEAKAKFAEVVAKAAAGEEIVLTKTGRPVVRMDRYEQQTKRPGLIGLCKDAPLYIAEDFDEWPEDIARALGIID
jgi:antitoxin (DNA-binding transcriptional repressor) of toxin-antitoxin stability system